MIPLLFLAFAFMKLVNSSTAQSPTVSFTTPGTKVVTLTACNSAGCSTVTKTLTVLDPAPQAGPIVGPAVVGTFDGPVTFSATASGRPPLSPAWTLLAPDGSSSFAPSTTFSWSPTLVGTYSLQFQVLSLYGSKTSTLAVSSIPTAFVDVLPNGFAAAMIEALYFAGVTSGCSYDPTTGLRNFCPNNTVSRAELAVFIGTAFHGSGFVPQRPVGLFADVPPTFWAAAWIEQAVRDGFASACSPGPHPLYCPAQAATRADIAQQVVHSSHGPSFTPPPATGIFADVPPSDPAAPWIEQLYRDGVTSGCQGPPVRLFCPLNTVTRSQMAVFLVSAFHLTEKPKPITFFARLCSSSLCAFPAGMPINFDVQLTGGIPAEYDYDWNGDGIFDESAPFPVTHTYATPGLYTPKLRLRLGSWSATLTHPYAIRINAPSGYLSAPTGLTATSGTSLAPAATDPPGTPVLTPYSVSADSQAGLVGYAAFVNPGSGTYTFAGLLQPNRASATDRLLLPPPTPGTIRYLYLRPFSSTTYGTPSFSVRLP